ncbi:hypothetical protein [Lewinella sp. IMCC34191]|uniref:hypothetical protein n=1 Tax=Lewinella sp. IMCC34191 TaxID=2259172 RepID=UPI000E243308|nr:hypothetical protein [Lewinella sp. IMCC34191]
MKTSTLLLFCSLLGLMLWSGCTEDDDPSVLTTLNYDGPNDSAPNLPPGTNTFGVYFPPSQTGRYTGRRLESLRFYLSQIPEATTVMVMSEGPDDRTPGDTLYRRELTQRINLTEWIDDRLPDPIEITGEGLWLMVEVELPPGGGFSVGCDAGNNFNPNGNLLYLSTESEWTTFQDITGETVNWNIRGILSEG